jgi:hypothetical protein
MAHADRHADIRDAVLARYRAGESEKALAEAFGVGRLVVARLLRIAGVARRGRSASLRLRLSRMDTAARAALTAGAHTETARANGARTAARSLRKRGRWETELEIMLGHLGLRVQPQRAVGPYNLDLAIGALDIEVHAANSNPRRIPKIQRRVAALNAMGWRCCYVWIGSTGLTEEAAAAIARIVRRPRAWVVMRGDGQLVHDPLPPDGPRYLKTRTHLQLEP